MCHADGSKVASFCIESSKLRTCRDVQRINRTLIEAQIFQLGIAGKIYRSHIISSSIQSTEIREKLDSGEIRNAEVLRFHIKGVIVAAIIRNSNTTFILIQISITIDIQVVRDILSESIVREVRRIDCNIILCRLHVRSVIHHDTVLEVFERHTTIQNREFTINRNFIREGIVITIQIILQKVRTIHQVDHGDIVIHHVSTYQSRTAGEIQCLHAISMARKLLEIRKSGQIQFTYPALEAIQNFKTVTAGKIEPFQITSEAFEIRKFRKTGYIQPIDIAFKALEHFQIRTTGYIEVSHLMIVENRQFNQFIQATNIQIIQICIRRLKIDQFRAVSHIEIPKRITRAVQLNKIHVLGKIKFLQLVPAAEEIHQIRIVIQPEMLKIILFAEQSLEILVIPQIDFM